MTIRSSARSARKTQASEVSVRRPDPLVWKQALLLADGDAGRLTVEEDGTVTVANARPGGARMTSNWPPPGRSAR